MVNLDEIKEIVIIDITLYNEEQRKHLFKLLKFQDYKVFT